MTDENQTTNTTPPQAAEPHEGIAPPQVQVDPAMQSLSEALRISFRVLSGIMVLFVVLFLATGIKSIEPQEKGIIKVFGRITGVAEPGFVYNWPFPIGEIQVVQTQEKRLLVEDFWMHETAEEKLQDLSSRRRNNEGLRPGWDGYLLTGDRSIVHVKFVCVYRVQDPVAFRMHVQDESALMKSVLCEAAIRAAATRTSDAIQADPTDFLQQVRDDAQGELNRILQEDDAIKISGVLLPATDAKTWPLGAFNAYEAAQRAKSEKQTTINQAIGAAKGLMKVIGEKHFIELVGEPWNDPDVEAQRTKENADYNLIGQYGASLDKLDAERAKPQPADPVVAQLAETARRLRAKIDTVLTSATTGGEVSTLIAEAEADRTRIEQTASRRMERFQQLVAEYRKSPRVFLEKIWVDALDEILNEPAVTKYYVNPGEKGMVVHINPDPDVLRELRRYYKQQEKQPKANR